MQSVTIPVVFIKLALIPSLIAVMLFAYWQTLILWDKIEARRIMKRAAKEGKIIS